MIKEIQINRQKRKYSVKLILKQHFVVCW